MGTRLIKVPLYRVVVLLVLLNYGESASVTKISPNKGSTNGGTRITIDGDGFSANQFNFGSGNEHLGNVVKLVSSNQVYDCEIHKDGSHEKQIMCYTEPMPSSDYTVKITVDGNEVSLGSICTSSNCKFKPQTSNTPTVTNIEPTSGPAGSLLKLTGKLFTDRYGSNIQQSSNGRENTVLRVSSSGQSCELKNGDSFYGIVLNNGGASDDGYMKCKINGTFVGNQNATFMISDEFGRALPNKDLYKVSSNSQLYMFQSYAEIYNITPSSGSIEGGTLLTISGINFDETRSKATVDVGGVNCVVKTVTNNEIVCRTDKPPSPTPPAYTGNRGLIFETWNTTSKTQAKLSEIASLETNASDYESSHIDEAYFMEYTWDNYASRMRGFFIVPFNGSYSFHIKADDGAELHMSTDGNPANLAKVATATYTTSYSRFPEQSSSRMTLNAGQTIYIEVYHRDVTSGSSASVSARYYESPITNVMTGNAKLEVQKIEVRSSVTREKQVISVNGFTDKTPTHEVQEVVIENNGQTDGSYRLGMYDVFTSPIDFQTDVANVAKAISSLPVFDSKAESVSVTEATTATQGIKYTVTFVTERGDLPALQYQNVSGTYLTVDVSEKTNGRPSGKYFVLSMENVPSPLLSRTASASDVQKAMDQIFGTRCPDYIGKPTGQSQFYNYEDSAAVPSYNRNQRVTDVEAFCGIASLKNPSYLYKRKDDKDVGLSLTMASTMCFAYKGSISANIWVTYKYKDQQSETVETSSTLKNAFVPSSATTWQYTCVDLLTLVKAKVPTGTNFYLQFARIGRSGDLYVDEVFFGRSATTTATSGIDKVRLLPAKPNGAMIQSATVVKSSGAYEVTLVPYDCGYNFQTFQSSSGQIPAGGSVQVSRTSSASPPIQGTFSVTFNSQTVSGLTADITPEALEASLETISDIGSLSVSRAGDCANFDFIINFLTKPGDPPLIQVDGTQLTGTSVTMLAKGVSDGHLLFDPLPGEMLRTVHDKPQVIAKINDIPTKCLGDCAYEWTVSSTPNVTSVSPSTGNPGTPIIISGTDFHLTPENNTVSIGGVGCVVTASTSNTITCNIGNGPDGIYKIDVNVYEKGIARHSSGPVNFIYSSNITDISPNNGSLGGGIPLTVTGYGFRLSATVKVGTQPCVATSNTHSQIVCTVPASSTSGSVKVKVLQTGVADMTSPEDFSYDNSITASISSISPTSSGVSGGAVLTVTGSGFGGSGTLRIGGKTVTTSSYSNTQVTAELPALTPGTHSVELITGSRGAAVDSQNAVPSIDYILKIKNVYPLRGSMYGGTRLTLTGEGFGNGVEVKVGPHNCSVESVISTKIVCLIDDTATIHEVNNDGVHWAFGKGYAWNPENLRVKTGDIVRWSWTYPSWLNLMTPKVEQTVNAIAVSGVPGGFSSGAAVKTGAYEHKFTKTGTNYYWSGYVDSYETTWFRGSIQVENAASSIEEVSVKLSGFEAQHVVGGASNPADSGVCPGVSSSVAGCNDPLPSGGDPAKFRFTFWKCYTPTVQGISESNGTTSTSITISGQGLSTTNCQNEVTFGSSPCTVDSSSSSSVSCKMDVGSSPPVGVQQTIGYRVSNLGNALIEIDGQTARTYALYPLVKSVTPKKGSRGGHTKITITGSGYGASVKDVDLTVTISEYPCAIESFSYTSIVCSTPISASNGIKTLEVKVKVNGNMIAAQCDTSCEFVYEDAATPTIASITPNTVSGVNTKLTISGTNFGSQTSDVNVEIGGEVCATTAVGGGKIECNITYLPVGSHAVVVDITDVGRAIHDSGTVEVTGMHVISSVNPSQGSTNGGTVVTITGNGFEPNTTATIDGVACDVQAVSLSTVKCKTAAHAAASTSLVVVSNSVTYSNQTFTFSSGATPSISSVSPNSGSVGNSITLAGTHFGAINSDNTVYVGSKTCTITSSSPTQIQCTVGDHKAGPYNLKVDVKGKGYSNSDVTFTFAMTVSSISPSTGSTAGGQTVTVSGSGFDNDTVVAVCGNNCTKQQVPAVNQYICTTPPASGVVVSTQVCNVVVTSNAVTQTLSNSYTYNTALTPEITGVNPARGGTGGGTTVTITGSSFGGVKGNGVVTIGGTPCIISSLSSTQIVCVTEAHTPSEKTQVRVEISGNGIAKQTSADFEYIDVWSAVHTWGGSSVPTDGDLVVIPKGKTILLDTNTAVLKMLLIQGGELIFDEKDVELQADNILITNKGLLQVGTEANPFQHKAIITLHGHHRTKELPIYGTKSMAVREGTLDLHGIPITTTWTKLAATANAGSDQIVLVDAVSWNVGDEIVIASTGKKHSQSENELHKIKDIAGDRKTITLQSNLKHSHISVQESLGGRMLEFRAEVGVLTRNILVRGTSHKDWKEKIEACPDGFNTGEFATQTCFQGRFGEEMGSDQFGAQVMIHAPEKDKKLSTGRIEFVEFFHVGQAFRLGRYPVHFHLNGDMSHSYVRGCGIHESFNRAVNVHGTYNTLVERNVIYNIMGGAFFLEDGIETGNTFQYNLGVFVIGSSSLLNDDVTPATFWVTNPNNTIRHNAAAGGTHFGFWYRMHDHPEGPSRTSTICPKLTPNGQFLNNSAHSFGWFGLWIFPTHIPRTNGACGSSTPAPTVFEGLYSWNNEKGAEAVNSGSLQFKDFTLVNNQKAGYEGKLIVEGDQYTSDGPLIEDSLIVGYASSFSSQGCTDGGIVFPYGNGFQARNIHFVNFDSSCSALTWTRITGTCSDKCGGFLYKTSGLQFTNAPNRGNYAWLFEGIVEDTDGSLCGSNGCKVLPSTGTLPPSCLPFSYFNRGIPASYCPSSVKIHRFAFNNIAPSSLEFKRVTFVNQYGNSTVEFKSKRITHKPGWMAGLVSGENYAMVFEDAPPMTNLSFTGTFYQFEGNDYVFMRQKVLREPDRFQTDNRGFRNATTALDGATGYHGDWEFISATNEIKYLVSARQPVGRRRKRASPSPNSNSGDLSIKFQSVKCFYTDCIPPPDPNTIPPVDVQPADPLLWSNASSWPHYNNTLPQDGDDVEIVADTWVIADIQFPWINTLTIYGVLEFDNKPDANGTYKSFTLNATYIIIVGGRLVVGFPNEPFLGTANILLRGDWSTPAYTKLNNAPVVGSKVIAVLGGLDLHGRDVGVYWTKLQQTANAGDTTITLSQNVSWQVNDEIVISPTSYDMWETETFTITAVSSTPTSTQLTLNGTLKYRHIVHQETIDGRNVTIAAEVGLLTRNVKVIGEDYAKLFKESFGARILVGTGQMGSDAYLGYARLSNTEFFHAGQEGYTDFYDARFALTFLDVGTVTSVKPSYVKKCAFHNNFSPAIGVFGTNGLNIEDNVFHHTVWWGVQTSAANTAFRRNLFVLMVWEGAYLEREEADNFRYNGAISAIEATGLILEDNAVAGSERLGYHVPPEECGPNTKYSGNSVHTSLQGIGIFPGDKLSVKCGQFSNFTVWKNRDIGIYFNNKVSSVISDNIVVENTIGIYNQIIGPSAVGHQYAPMTALVSNCLIVGATASFDCTADRFKSDENIQFSSQGRAWNGDGSHIGVAYSTFAQGPNMAPKKPHFGMMTYPAIMGLMKLEDLAMKSLICHNTLCKQGTHYNDNANDKSLKSVDLCKITYDSSDCTFAKFDAVCGRNDFAVTTSKSSDDGLHPIESRGIKMINVNTDNIYLNHRPNIGKINSADCVDMDCDGLKKALWKDEDGSLLGGNMGSIISQSEWEWDGDRRRGLGDYRIPKEMLTRLDGSRINVNDIAPNKGIIRNNQCTYKSAWQAYQCHGLDYEMLIIESMDSDTETRRLSPVAILGDGYLDLINGPQDHGWCSGYTCRRRISTFMAIVATGKDYLIHFTSTSPQHMRYFLLNSNSSQSVALSVWYSQPNRRDVYHNGVFIRPQNGRTVNGRYILDPPRTPDEFKPNVTSDSSGTNYYDRDAGIVYIIIKGNDPVEVKTMPSVIVSFQYPAMSVDEFYGDNIVQYLAAFFNLPPEKVRVVNIVRQTSPSGRRKRSVSSNDAVTVEIADPPSNDINSTAPSPLSNSDLDTVSSKLYNEVQLGNISDILNNTVVSVGIAPNLPEPGSPEWSQSTPESAYEIIVEADKMRFNPEPTPQHEGVPFKVQPKIQVLDKMGQPIKKLGTIAHPWKITANLTSGSNPLAELTGNLTVTFVDGWANFTDLLITQLGDNFIINFTVSYPDEGKNFSISSDPMTIIGRPIKAQVSPISSTIIQGSFVRVDVKLIDSVTTGLIEDISWRGHTWKLTAELGMPELYNGTLEGTNETTFDVANSGASFYSLVFTNLGVYVLKLRVKTEPSGYDFYEEIVLKVRTSAQAAMTIEETKTISLKFDADYDTVVGTQSTYFGAMVGNSLQLTYPDIILDSITVSRGSIYVGFSLAGSTSNLNTTLFAICNSIQSGQTFTFNSVSLTLSGYMNVGGQSFYGVSCAQTTSTDDSDSLPVAAIIAIVLSCLALLIFGIIVVVWKFKVQPKSKTSDVNGTFYIGQVKNIEDILFREKSFMSIRENSSGMFAAPADTTMTYRYDRKTPI